MSYLFSKGKKEKEKKIWKIKVGNWRNSFRLLLCSFSCPFSSPLTQLCLRSLLPRSLPSPRETNPFLHQWSLGALRETHATIHRQESCFKVIRGLLVKRGGRPVLVDGHDADKLLKFQVEMGMLFCEVRREADRAEAGWKLGVKKEHRGSKALGKSLMLLEENREKVLRSHGRRIRFSFSLEREPVWEEGCHTLLLNDTALFNLCVIHTKVTLTPYHWNRCLCLFDKYCQACHPFSSKVRGAESQDQEKSCSPGMNKLPEMWWVIPGLERCTWNAFPSSSQENSSDPKPGFGFALGFSASFQPKTLFHVLVPFTSPLPSPCPSPLVPGSSTSPIAFIIIIFLGALSCFPLWPGFMPSLLCMERFYPPTTLRRTPMRSRSLGT